MIFMILATFYIACSSENENEEAVLLEKKFLKSRIYTNLPADIPNRDEFYEYKNELLKTASGGKLQGEYSYDSDEKLTLKSKGSEQFSYEYDGNGRIIKQNEIGTNNYIELFYENNKVITHRYYEFGNTNGAPNSYLEERELLIDNQGRITKMVDLATNQSPSDTDYEIYEYDGKGNISRVITKKSNQQEERISNYEYMDVKNPYFYSLKKYYEKTYYLEFYSGLNFEKIDFVITSNYGITPNLIWYDDIKTYEVNDFYYPTKEFYKQHFTNVYEIIYEYSE